MEQDQKVPVGTTAQRPTGQGDFRYNSTTGNFEDIPILGVPLLVVVEEQQKLTLQFLLSITGVGSFATASFRSASVAQIDQTGSGFQVGRYLMIHDGTNVTVVEESAVATGDMLGSFDGAIVGQMLNLESQQWCGNCDITTKIDTVTV